VRTFDFCHNLWFCSKNWEQSICECIALKTITIPGSIETVGDDPFAGYPWLREVRVVGEGQGIKMIDGILYDKEMTKFIWCSPEKGGSCEIPNTVKFINWRYFRWNRNLTSITLPDSVKEIPSCAFEGCCGLKTVVITSPIISIGDKAFKGCNSLNSLVIPDSVTSIGERAFAGCSSLKTVSIPEGVKYPSNAFPTGTEITKF